MCGVFGAFGRTLNRDVWDGLYTLGIVSQFRGIDSAGLAYGGYNSKEERYKYNIIRTVGDTGDLFHTGEFDKLPNKTDACVALGHCRAATVGVVNEANAHPFKFDGLIGMHNGTLRSITGTKETCDSYEFYGLLNEYKGDFKAIHADILKQHDAYAFIWVDTKLNTLNMVRNTQRPLWLMPSVEKPTSFSTVFYASEEDFLTFMKKRTQGIRTYAEPKMLQPDQWYTWELGNAANLDIRTLTRVTASAEVKETFVFDYKKQRMVSKKERDEERAAEIEKESALVPFENDLPPLTPGNDLGENVEVGERDGNVIPLCHTLPLISKEGLEIFQPWSIHSVARDEQYPSRVCYKNEQYILRYLGYQHGLYAPSVIKSHLREGSSWTSRKPHLKRTDVYWFADSLFIWGDDELNDEYVTQYLLDGSDKVWRGQLVYVKQRDWQRAVQEKKV